MGTKKTDAAGRDALKEARAQVRELEKINSALEEQNLGFLDLIEGQRETIATLQRRVQRLQLSAAKSRCRGAK